MKSSIIRFMTVLLLCAASSLVFSSCANTKVEPPTEDGCYLITQTTNGKTFSSGPCVSSTGKIDRIRAQWKNSSGINIATTYTLATRKTQVTFQYYGLPPVIWTPESGISLDGAPDGSHLEAAPNGGVPVKLDATKV